MKCVFSDLTYQTFRFERLRIRSRRDFSLDGKIIFPCLWKHAMDTSGDGQFIK